MITVTYEYYTNTYGGTTISADAFSSYNKRAGLILDRLTYGRIRDNDQAQPCIRVGAQLIPLTASEIDALQMALCSIMDAAQILDQQEAQSLAGAGSAGNVHSRTSGGESITYGSKTTAYDNALGDEAGAMTLYRNKALMYIDPHAFRYNPFYAGCW